MNVFEYFESNVGRIKSGYSNDPDGVPYDNKLKIVVFQHTLKKQIKLASLGFNFYRFLDSHQKICSQEFIMSAYKQQVSQSTLAQALNFVIRGVEKDKIALEYNEIIDVPAGYIHPDVTGLYVTRPRGFGSLNSGSNNFEKEGTVNFMWVVLILESEKVFIHEKGSLVFENLLDENPQRYVDCERT